MGLLENSESCQMDNLIELKTKTLDLELYQHQF